MMNYEVWGISCYCQKKGRYVRFLGCNHDAIQGIFKSLLDEEQKAFPLLEKFELVPVDQVSGMQAWAVICCEFNVYYPRFVGVNQAHIEKWFQWTQQHEPDTCPRLGLFNLVRVKPGIIVEVGQ